MCSLLHGREEVTIRENVQFLRAQYDQDDRVIQEDLCYDEVATRISLSTPEEATSLQFWRSVYHCRMSAFLDTSVIPSISALLTLYDPSQLDGKTQLQLLAVPYGRAIAPPRPGTVKKPSTRT